jgi:hypothetical protein
MGPVTLLVVLLQRGLDLEAKEPLPLVDHEIEGVVLAKRVCYAPALPN